MGMFSKSKKDFKLLEPWVVHLQGLPNTKIMNCRLKHSDGYLVINTMTGGIFKPKNVDKVYKISIDKIISLDILTQKNIVEKNKSVIGRGIVGGAILGPAGMILGGLSGTVKKQHTKIKFVLNLAYYGDSEDDIKVIVFNADTETSSTIEFVNGFRKMYLQEELKTNEAGEILL